MNIQKGNREKSKERCAGQPNFSILCFSVYLELYFLSLNGLNSPWENLPLFNNLTVKCSGFLMSQVLGSCLGVLLLILLLLKPLTTLLNILNPFLRTYSIFRCLCISLSFILCMFSLKIVGRNVWLFLSPFMEGRSGFKTSKKFGFLQ